jgi:hypothetical protein
MFTNNTPYNKAFQIFEKAKVVSSNRETSSTEVMTLTHSTSPVTSSPAQTP